jgi:hypothetical protein
MYHEKHAKNYSSSPLLVAVTHDKTYTCFIKHPDDNNMNSVRQFVVSDGKICYIHDRDRFIINVILRSMDLMIDDKRLVKLNDFDEAKIFIQNANTMFFFDDNLQHPSFLKTFENEKVGICHFDDSDVHKVRFYLPSATIQNYNWKRVFKKYLDDSSVKRTLIFDNVLATSTNTPSYLVDYIIKYFADNEEALNLHHQRFAVHPLVATELFVNNKPIIMPLRLNVTRPLKGFYDGNKDIFILGKVAIDDTPLQEGDAIVLTKQPRPIENGEYRVLSVDKEKKMSMLKPTTRKFDANKNSDPFDSKYICFTDKSIKIKGLCESDYDISGRPKARGVWDKPCTNDKECPFFQRNTNYQNYRGGCNDGGYCEMPLGVKRTGFKTYEGKPFCHGCPDKIDPNCCNEQHSPDYAFEMDDYERLPKITERRSHIERFENAVAFPEKINDEYIPGDQANTHKTGYHHEVSNEQFDSILQNFLRSLDTLKGKVYIAQESIPSMENVLKAVFRKHVTLSTYQIHNVKVISKDVRIDSVPSPVVTYTLHFTMYRFQKSHGKRIEAVIHNDPITNSYTIHSFVVVGMVPEENIQRIVSPTNPHVSTFTSTLCTQQRLDVNIAPQPYICERAKKLKDEYNFALPKECT